MTEEVPIAKENWLETHRDRVDDGHGPRPKVWDHYIRQFKGRAVHVWVREQSRITPPPHLVHPHDRRLVDFDKDFIVLQEVDHGIATIIPISEIVSISCKEPEDA